MTFCCRGVRGAITVDENSAQAILSATEELLRAIIAANRICEQDVASVFFTVTPDLDAVCPAVAARQLGWTRTALLCLQEMAVPGGLPRCIRVLIHWNTGRSSDEIRHIYLREARQLRPDLASRDDQPETWNL
jgi:chorismate mutase